MAEVLQTAARHGGAEWCDDVGIDYVQDHPPTVVLDHGRLTVRQDVYEPPVEYRPRGVNLSVSSSTDRLTTKLTYAPSSPVPGGPGGLGDRLRAGLLGPR
jgi:hypothetical protein